MFHRSLFTEDASCLCQSLTFACEQVAFTDEFSMVERQVVCGIGQTDLLRQLSRQILRQRLHFIQSAPALIQIYLILLAQPAFCISAVCPELGRCGRHPFRNKCSVKCRPANHFIEFISIEGNFLSVQRGLCSFHLKRVIQRKSMCDLHLRLPSSTILSAKQYTKKSAPSLQRDRPGAPTTSKY